MNVKKKWNEEAIFGLAVQSFQAFIAVYDYYIFFSSSLFHFLIFDGSHE